MQFYRPARKQLTVPIVPLIDILVTLLFFFIVTMAEMEQKRPRPVMKLTLPTAKGQKVQSITTRRAVLSLNAQGEAELDGLAVPNGFLKEYLTSARSQAPELKLELRADEGCPWGAVLDAHGTAIQVGYPPNEIVNRVRRTPENTPAVGQKAAD